MARKRSSVQARKKAVEKDKQWKQWERRILGGVLGLLVIFAAIFVVVQGQGSSSEGAEGETAVTGLRTAPEVGALAPDFELPSKDGELLKLSDFRGQPVAVTFMHTW